MHYQKARAYVLRRLQEELPEKLYYHGIHHTLDVCHEAEELAAAENVKGDNLVLLRTAALYHDIGFVEQYENHESVACRIAEESLPHFDYAPEQITVINHIIAATRIPQSPVTHLEEIMCDADLDYLGRHDFFQIAETLQKEWMAYGLISSEEEWNCKQVEFFEKHHYFTTTAREKRALQKSKHLLILRKRL